MKPRRPSQSWLNRAGFHVKGWLATGDSELERQLQSLPPPQIQLQRILSRRIAARLRRGW